MPKVSKDKILAVFDNLCKAMRVKNSSTESGGWYVDKSAYGYRIERITGKGGSDTPLGETRFGPSEFVSHMRYATEAVMVFRDIK